MIDMLESIRKQTPELFEKINIPYDFSFASLVHLENYLKSQPKMNKTPESIIGLTPYILYLGDVVIDNFKKASWNYGANPDDTYIRFDVEGTDKHLGLRPFQVVTYFVAGEDESLIDFYEQAKHICRLI